MFWLVGRMPCARATGQSFITCEFYQPCASASRLKRFWLFQLRKGYPHQPHPCGGRPCRTKSLASLMQNLRNDTCVCPGEELEPERGTPWRKKENCVGGALGDEGTKGGRNWRGCRECCGDTGEANFTVFCQTGVVIWALDQHHSGYKGGFHLPSSWSQTWAGVSLWLMNYEPRQCVALLCRSFQSHV